MNSQVEQVNALLFQGEPANISIDEHSGYTGYKPQAVVDAMNEVLFGAWGFEEVSSEIEPGDKGSLAVAQVRVWLKDIEFRPVAWGQNRVTRGDIGDARKGAQTDAIKKALSYFSIGNRAYHGLLDSKKPTTKPATSPVSSQVSNHPASSTQTPSESPEEVKKLLGTVKSLLNAHYQIPQIDQPAKWRNFKELVLGLPVEDEGLSLPELKRLRDAVKMKIQNAKGAA